MRASRISRQATTRRAQQVDATASRSENSFSETRTLCNLRVSRTDRSQPVERQWLPKNDGKKLRPLGFPALEDKIVARAVTLLLEQIYEQVFCDFSFGFRPGRSTP